MWRNRAPPQVGCRLSMFYGRTFLPYPTRAHCALFIVGLRRDNGLALTAGSADVVAAEVEEAPIGESAANNTPIVPRTETVNEDAALFGFDERDRAISGPMTWSGHQRAPAAIKDQTAQFRGYTFESRHRWSQSQHEAAQAPLFLQQLSASDRYRRCGLGCDRQAV
jgi:hypothetical protein